MPVWLKCLVAATSVMCVVAFVNAAIESSHASCICIDDRDGNTWRYRP